MRGEWNEREGKRVSGSRVTEIPKSKRVMRDGRQGMHSST